MNTIHVRGRLKDGVKVTQTSTGTYILKGTIADNYSWSKDTGVDKVNWVNFTRFFRKEPSEKYVARLSRGNYVIVDGRLETNRREVNNVVYNNIEVIASSLEAPFAPKTTNDAMTPVSDTATAPAAETAPADPDLPF